jgi:hypothetical protein
MKVSGVIVGVFIVLGLRLFLQHQYKTVITEATSGGPASCLTLLGSTTRDENRMTYIVGNFRNDCKRSVSQVTVVFRVPGPADSKFNSRDAVLYAYERNVAPGEVRQFKTMFQAGKNSVSRFDHFAAY